jgi:acetyl-CoA synthetase (ADP-forming)
MSRTLSEADSKELLAAHGIRFVPEELVDDPESAVIAADSLGYPVVAKLCGENIAHKSERGLVRLSLGSAQDVRTAVTDLFAAAVPDDLTTGVLIAPMIRGDRELIAGVATDPQFGPIVMLGVGGVLAEAVEDVSVRLAPITELDAVEMIEELRSQVLLGEFRGEPAIDREVLVGLLRSLSVAATNTGGTRVVSADINPLIVCDGVPVPVDALVELAERP